MAGGGEVECKKYNVRLSIGMENQYVHLENKIFLPLQKPNVDSVVKAGSKQRKSKHEDVKGINNAPRMLARGQE